MLEEITITMEDRPGLLADIGEILGSAGVNIETLSASSHDGQAVVRLVVDDGEEAAETLSVNGFKLMAVRAVLAATLEDKPGELGRYCRRLADAGVDISAAYVGRRGGGETELIIAVDDLEAAKKA